MTHSELFSIGELARRTGVPVKTIRHYAEEGVLVPSALSDAGYRMYSDDDQRRLITVRSLRALGFSLPAISSMLDGSRDPHDLAAIQLELVETQLRALQRQRAVLQAAGALPGVEVMRSLDAAYAAASLGAAERASRLERWLARAETVDPGARGRAEIRAMVLDGLPEELSLDQLSGWIRLSALLDDESFLDTLRAQHEPFASVSPEDRAAFGSASMEVLGEALELLASGAKPQDENVRALARRWAQLYASTLHRADHPAFATWFLEYARRTNDPRIEQFWNDVAVLRATPPMPPFTRATALLCEALAIDSSQH
jgi:DNA-binding transcriptional MerR regulator